MAVISSNVKRFGELFSFVEKLPAFSKEWVFRVHIFLSAGVAISGQ